MELRNSFLGRIVTPPSWRLTEAHRLAPVVSELVDANYPASVYTRRSEPLVASRALKHNSPVQADGAGWRTSSGTTTPVFRASGWSKTFLVGLSGLEPLTSALSERFVRAGVRRLRAHGGPLSVTGPDVLRNLPLLCCLVSPARPHVERGSESQEEGWPVGSDAVGGWPGPPGPVHARPVVK